MGKEQHRLMELAEDFDNLIQGFKDDHDLSDDEIGQGMIAWMVSYGVIQKVEEEDEEA